MVRLCARFTVFLLFDCVALPFYGRLSRLRTLCRRRRRRHTDMCTTVIKPSVLEGFHISAAAAAQGRAQNVRHFYAVSALVTLGQWSSRVLGWTHNRRKFVDGSTVRAMMVSYRQSIDEEHRTGRVLSGPKVC